MLNKMTPEEAISYIENYGWSTTRLGLDRTRALLDALGNPQKKLKFIHVAGSNGKGSTCSMLAEILKNAGYRTGLYISPYIEVFNERIQINGEYISGERLAGITERVKGYADSMEDHPSQFELVTAIAIQYYYEEDCDIVVLEVGMGGALDSTNAIDSPEVAVITNIGLEHTEYLGNTLEEIAETKGGIIKPGCNCVCYDSAPEVINIISKICKEKDVTLSKVDFARIRPLSSNLDGQRFVYISDSEKEYNLSLLGRHQLHNAAVVLSTIESLGTRGWMIDDDSIKAGLSQVKWPARFEVLTKDPTFILDGGHNPQCAEALVESIKEYLPDEKIVFLLGVLADKDYGGIIEMMMPYAEEFICVTPLSNRALPCEELASFIKEKGGKAVAVDSISKGIVVAQKTAQNNGLAVIAFGSLYLAGAVRGEFKAAYKRFLRSYAISRRNSLSEKERIEKSKQILERLINLPEYKAAKNVLLYKWTKGEVRLDELEVGGEFFDEAKTLIYPLCVNDETLVAVNPGEGEDAWKRGNYEILEPCLEKGTEVEPEDIDLVICPIVAFDEENNRMGMGSGYYDRYLPGCVNAIKVGVAFDVQCLRAVPVEPHDYKLDMIITDGEGCR